MTRAGEQGEDDEDEKRFFVVGDNKILDLKILEYCGDREGGEGVE